MTDKPLSWTGCIREDYSPGIFDPIEAWEQWLAEVQAKLAGRRLATWAHPGAYLSTHAKTGTDVVTSCLELPLDTAPN